MRYLYIGRVRLIIFFLAFVASDTWWNRTMPAAQEVKFGTGLGALEGWVRLIGEVTPESIRIENTTDPEVCGRWHSVGDLVISSDGGGIRNVILSLASTSAMEIPPYVPAHLVLDNRECRFSPHASVLTVGSTIEAANSDSTLHTVHFYGAMEGNLALPFRGSKITRKVEEKGMIIAKCDVHGWMQAFIRVDDHPFHAVSDENGAFRIPNIPVGIYDLEIWHEKLGRRQKTVYVEEGKITEIEVVYALDGR